MKKVILPALLLITFLFAFTYWKKDSALIDKAKTSSESFALVELFTSEGCSSCPSADALISKIKSEYQNKPVFIISYHVDYWNRLGWFDRFSSPDYSIRQTNYARKLRTSVYTPQVVVNGNTESVGSNSAKLHDIINKNLKSAKQQKISFSAKRSNHEITIDYDLGKNERAETLNFVLLQNEASSKIKSGENNGRNLHHVNIAREIKSFTDYKSSGSIKMRIPDDLLKEDLSLAGFTQGKNLEIFSAEIISLK